MAEEKKRQVPMVAPTRWQLAEHGMRRHVITAESSEHPEDFLQPEFYAHVAKNFTQFDEIVIRTDDGMYWGEFLVLGCDLQWAKVEKLREVNLQPVNERPMDDRFIVKWKGPHLKWCAIRTQDSSIIHEGEQNRAAAMGWLEGYIRTIGKKAA